MYEDVMNAIAKIARKYNMPAVYVIKYFTAKAIVKFICRELDLEEWEYGCDIFRNVVRIARIAQIPNVGELTMKEIDEYYRVDPVSLESTASLEEEFRKDNPKLTVNMIYGKSAPKPDDHLDDDIDPDELVDDDYDDEFYCRLISHIKGV